MSGTEPQSPPPQTPGKRLKLALQSTKVTQVEVGRRTDSSKSYVNDIIHGRRTLTEGFAQTVQTEFGIDKIWLLFGEGNMIRSLPSSPTATGVGVPVDMVLVPALDRPTRRQPQKSPSWHGTLHPIPRGLATASMPKAFRYVLRVNGWGRKGEIRDGDLLLVETIAESGEPLPEGAFVGGLRKGRMTFRRLKKNADVQPGKLCRCVGLLWRDLALPIWDGKML